MAQYTQKAIIHTFHEMLRKMPFDKITVSALVANCQISSNTFYYHYQDIYDLLDAWLQTMKKRYLTDVMVDKSWQEAVRELLYDMKQNPDLVYHLFRSLSRERIERYVFESTDDTFYQIVCQKTAGVPIPEQELRDIVEYNSYSFEGFFIKFLWNQMQDDIEGGIEKISRIFDRNIQWVCQKYIEK